MEPSTTLGAIGALGALDAAAIATWYACSYPESQILCRSLIRGPAEGNRIALTFDDGPLAPFTGEVLDILRARQVPATFFVCGRNVERYPELIRRISAEGHLIGNHTWSHPYLYFMSRRQMAEEIDRTQQIVREITGQEPRFFRPPYGARWFGIRRVLRERNLQMVQWSALGLDCKLSAEEVVRAAQTDLRPGAILLLHDGRQIPGSRKHQFSRNGYAGAEPPSGDSSETVRALPGVIDAARAAGFTFVSLDEFLPSRQLAARPVEIKS